MTLNDVDGGSTDNERASAPRLTFFHVLWLVLGGGVASFVFFVARGPNMVVRLLIAGAALLVALALTHLVIVYIVTAWVLPRLKSQSYWSGEVDSYMASLFPGKWGKPAGGA